MSRRRIATVVAAGIAAAVALGVAVVLGLLIALDRGGLDATIARLASARLHRPVRFAALRSRAFSARPEVEVTGLRIGNPAWAASAPELLTARRITARFTWRRLLTGQFAPLELEVDGAVGRLLRLDENRQNWAVGGGGGASPLAKVRRLRITDSAFSLDDRPRQIHLAGTVAHDAAIDPIWPMRASAQGVIRGGAVSLAVQGGPLNARPKGAGHAIAAELRDGALRLAVKGRLDQPLSFHGFDLQVEAQGPNLAALDDLLGLGTPNTTPFRLSGRLQRKGEVTRASNLKGVIGSSDLAGSIVSDGSGRRRLVEIELTAGTLHIRDVAAILSGRPPHAVARTTPGTAGGNGPRLFSDKPLDLARFNLKDYTLKLRARRFVTGALATGALSTSGRLRDGVLVLDPFDIAFPSGRFQATYRLDLRNRAIGMWLDGRLSNARLASLAPGIGQGLDGVVALRVKANGAGRSIRQIVTAARGGAVLELQSGTLKRSTAKVLSGALVEGALASVLSKSARTPVACAKVEADFGDGRLTSREITIVTDQGTTAGAGYIDLGRETIAVNFYGSPRGPALFRSRRPITVSGPLLDPHVALRGEGEAPRIGQPAVVAGC